MRQEPTRHDLLAALQRSPNQIRDETLRTGKTIPAGFNGADQPIQITSHLPLRDNISAGHHFVSHGIHDVPSQ